jgi:hypothetical protein
MSDLTPAFAALEVNLNAWVALPLTLLGGEYEDDAVVA